MTKAYKQSAKVTRLLERGTWIEGDVGGQRVPYFLMPTSELQEELNDALDGAIKKHLKQNGWERVCATERRHPFHSEILRDRIDGRDRSYLTEENTKKTRRKLMGQVYYSRKHDVAPTRSSLPDTFYTFTKEDVDAIVDLGVKEARQRWAANYNKWADFQRNPTFYQGTYVERIFCPPGALPIPDGPRPKPVFISKQTPDIVIRVADGFVKLWTKPDQLQAV